MSDQTECTIICTDCLNHQPDGARKRSQPTPLPTHSTSIERVEGGFFACSGCTQSFLGVFVIAKYSVFVWTDCECLCNVFELWLSVHATYGCNSEWVRYKEKGGQVLNFRNEHLCNDFDSFLHFQFQFYGIAPLFSIIIFYLSKIKLDQVNCAKVKYSHYIVHLKMFTP